MRQSKRLLNDRKFCNKLYHTAQLSQLAIANF